MSTVVFCNRCGDDDNGDGGYKPVLEGVGVDHCPDCAVSFNAFKQERLEANHRDLQEWLNTKVDKDHAKS